MLIKIKDADFSQSGLGKIVLVPESVKALFKGTDATPEKIRLFNSFMNSIGGIEGSIWNKIDTIFFPALFTKAEDKFFDIKKSQRFFAEEDLATFTFTSDFHSFGRVYSSKSYFNKSLGNYKPSNESIFGISGNYVSKQGNILMTISDGTSSYISQSSQMNIRTSDSQSYKIAVDGTDGTYKQYNGQERVGIMVYQAKGNSNDDRILEISSPYYSGGDGVVFETKSGTPSKTADTNPGAYAMYLSSSSTEPTYIGSCGLAHDLTDSEAVKLTEALKLYVDEFDKLV